MTRGHVPAIAPEIIAISSKCCAVGMVSRSSCVPHELRDELYIAIMRTARLITVLLQCCAHAPYIDLCVHSSTGKICPIWGHGKSPDFVVVQEGGSDWLVGLKVPNANRIVL